MVTAGVGLEALRVAAVAAVGWGGVGRVVRGGVVWVGMVRVGVGGVERGMSSVWCVWVGGWISICIMKVVVKVSRWVGVGVGVGMHLVHRIRVALHDRVFLPIVSQLVDCHGGLEGKHDVVLLHEQEGVGGFDVVVEGVAHNGDQEVHHA